MNKTIYIPWFGNQDDKIRKSTFPEAHIIQKSIKLISLETTARFIDTIDIDELRSRISEKYPSTTKEDFSYMLAEIMKFQGYTRKISTTISFTKNEIAWIIQDECLIKLAWHSQWWLVAIELILKYPEILDSIREIELFAPVGNYMVWKNFHVWKESWYINRKWVIVRKQYIDSLAIPSYSLLVCLAIRLRKSDFKWKFRIIYSENDPVIPDRTLELESVKMLFPEEEIINTKSDNHYLGY